MEQEDLGVLAPSSSLSPPQSKGQKGYKEKESSIPSTRFMTAWQMDSKHSVNMVVSIGPEPASLSWLARGSTDGHREVESPDSVPWGTTVEVGKFKAGVDSPSITPQVENSRVCSEDWPSTHACL